VALKLRHCRYHPVTVVFVNMVCSDEDKILIKNLCQLKEYKAMELNEFPNKWWTKSSNNRVLKNLRDTRAANRLTGSDKFKHCSFLR